MSDDPSPHGSEIRDGLADAAPVLVAVVPFAAVFGALATERGLSLWELIFASASIYAGASQYAMLDLMGQNVPAWSIVLAVFAINFRHVLYSAALGRRLFAFGRLEKVAAFFFLVDPLYAAAEARSKQRTIKPAYYFAYSAVIYTVWMSSNILGGLFGALIEDPSAFGLDFILPIYFIGLVFGFRRQNNFAPVFIVSIIASLVAFYSLGPPWHITVGGGAGLLLAASLSKPEDGQAKRKLRRHV